ncbi:hypothetical protein [Pontibacter anaerobius]|uniref:Rieske domain-containing protein n=1 Tax=Pontibacter anaerobius TaxID=2993940 RepID=A0ABT3RE43_9BACT|nr:hypothetical protein [Pontibacter anaerobius]MCX2740126.1 hypothetical protein [Pontibacter anaerobius]
MNLYFTPSVTKQLRNAAFILALCTVASCQPAETEQQEQAPEVTEAPAQTAAVAAEKRPAPEFFVIPENMLKKRVWICEDGVSDIFHVQHDCPVLIECRGKGTFRNLVLPRAIEDYGRYNCQVCSKDLDMIFDKDAVREMNR